jgi:hypothetical protein
MRTSLILSSIVGWIAIYTVANPTGDQSETEVIAKRQCNTGKYCCPVANPSLYCVRYCAGGSPYIHCDRSYVSLKTRDVVIDCTDLFIVRAKWRVPMRVSRIKACRSRVADKQSDRREGSDFEGGICGAFVPLILAIFVKLGRRPVAGV